MKWQFKEEKCRQEACIPGEKSVISLLRGQERYKKSDKKEELFCVLRNKEIPQYTKRLTQRSPVATSHFFGPNPDKLVNLAD